ncbi:hypothetical protein KIN20_017989 [Parelaphostrongylus tenuis]|uniref:Uncharacterized protein n=1 Tax=Parelaphostrongylus tenuis TaxID=148309 RepID=A0AAD5N333_PARTN|nr:hypothetical protein KIN20_017989 [Parelaphostrongylus tenuis]
MAHWTTLARDRENESVAGTHEDDISQLNNGTLITWGEKVPSRNVGGVGFVVHPSITYLVDSYKTLSPHPAILQLQLKCNTKIIVINCYLPTDAADERGMDAFHRQLEEVIRNDKKKEHRRWIWESPNGTTHADFDHILTNKK